MVIRLLRLYNLLLTAFLLPLLQGLETSDPGEVVYKESRTSGVVEHGAILECGTTLPDIYIWGFTKPGTDKILAVVYNLGKGPRLQQLAESLGDLNVIANSASLSIEKLPVAAEGLYTCQALYDTAEGARLYYYYVYLRVLVPVGKPHILLDESPAVEGSLFLMRCDLENGTNPIQYTWEQESRSGLVITLAKSNSSLLNITWVTRNHTGWYRCLAKNEVNQQHSDRNWLDVMFGPDLPQIDATAYSITEDGYSALEKGNISLMCQASSNPPSQYVWFYNNSEIFSGPELTITKILRMHTGKYGCIAKNMFLSTWSKKTITLSIYYPPDGSPSCSILPANNYTDLALSCSWVGGYPPATLNWSSYVNGNKREGIINVTQIQPGPVTANNSVFICYGSHVALNATQTCSTQTWLPYGEPQCSAKSSSNNEYLMLSCSWEGGFPRALLWWVSSSGDMQGTSEENSNILVLHSNANYSGKSFVCHTKHPLAKESKHCVLKLEAPILMTQNSTVSVFEGSDVQLTCALDKHYPPVSEITWYNNLRQNVGYMPKKYILQQTAPWSNLTVRDTDSTVDSGLYWCSAASAVGGTEIPIMLLVIRYPVPPNVTISKIIYSSSQRTDVNMEWLIQTDGDITGFFIERLRLPAPVGRGDIVPLWQKVAVDLEPSARSYQINNLDPTGKYSFRITAVNRRTVGNPSELKSPVAVPVSKPYILLSDSMPAEGSSVWMRCGLENGTNPIQYSWEQESRSGLIITLAESNSSLLNITWVTRNHTGWYRCLAKNEVNQQHSDRIWLDVMYGPNLPQIDATAYSVTETGYSALEKGNVSLMCQVSSNPPSRYIWLYNNSEIFSGPQLTIMRILRMHTGNYTCLAENVNLNTRSKKTITLTVYYPPEGAPLCTMVPVRNYTDLALSCSWLGGFPPPTLKWTPYENGDSGGVISNVTQIQAGPHTANNSVFICYGSHVALNVTKSCSIRTWLPYGEPQCSANSSSNNEYLMLSCFWEGGFPRALLWWVSSSGDMQGTSEENSNILVLRSSANYSGKAFVCHGKHPLAKERSRCVINLEAPVITTQHSVVSVFEGSDVQLTCKLSKHYPAVTEITWHNNVKQKVGDKDKKYSLQQAVGWSNLTVRQTDSTVDSGQYWCSATNAVGGAEIPIMLLVIMPVSKPYILQTDSSPAEGTSVWMRCVVEKGTGPVNYVWEQESRGGLVITLAESNSSLLNITWVTRNHTGWYRCLAKNEVNQQRSDRTWLDVMYGPDLPQIDATAYSVTERSYSVLEKGNISLMCQASSNPASRYLWFYNNSQIDTGPQLTITKVLRVQVGSYACLALNTYLNTRSKKTITLTIYYPPDGAPSCSILPANNYTDLALSCIWMGGYPPATLNWSSYGNGVSPQGNDNVTRIQPGPDTANNSVFICYGSHIALNVTQSCSTKTWLPYGEPQCSAYVTRNNEYLMLSCSWEGGFPRALLWWVSSSGDMQGTSEENSNILVLRSSATYSGKAFVCHAKHPLAKESKQCVLKLEAPVLMTQRSVVSVYEGNDVQLSCILSKNYPAVTEFTWYNNLKQNVGDTPTKYILQRAAAWSNLTVLETDSTVDSGQYWCSAANAVGGTEIPILLRVMRYPMPPNVTISKIIYSSSQRTDVNMDWLIQTDGDITGFFIERLRLPAPVGRGDIVPLWHKVGVELEPSTRSYQINNLDPTGKYSFRITAVNRRTVGHPSEVKSPANPPFRSYPSVIGAAIGGMFVATIPTVLLFLYVVRNRNNIPRLHDMMFGRQNSQSRETVNFPEDEVVGGTEADVDQGEGSSSVSGQ